MFHVVIYYLNILIPTKRWTAEGYRIRIRIRRKEGKKHTISINRKPSYCILYLILYLYLYLFLRAFRKGEPCNWGKRDCLVLVLVLIVLLPSLILPLVVSLLSCSLLLLLYATVVLVLLLRLVLLAFLSLSVVLSCSNIAARSRSFCSNIFNSLWELGTGKVALLEPSICMYLYGYIYSEEVEKGLSTQADRSD